MATPRKYFHDHFVLLLVSVEVFLAFLTAALILLRLSSERGDSYFVQYRSSQGIIGGYTPGGIADILGFIVFAFIVLISHVVLSLRCYPIHRQLALVVLSFGLLLLVLNIIVSNALLMLR